MKVVPIGVSARHVHLSTLHIAQLFGNESALSVLKPLSQPDQFAANEWVAIEGPKRRIERVRILGPARKQTQVEISQTDAFSLGVTPPIRESGDLKGSGRIKIIGPHGEVTIEEGLIIAQRHIHFHPDDAKRWDIENGEKLQVRLDGKRPVIFEDVVARISPFYRLDMHIDTDEANAAGVTTGDKAIILS